MRLDDLGEERIIKYLAKKFSMSHPRVIKAMGDDTSVSVQKGGAALLATTDTLTEGVHFRQALTRPDLLGAKALSISLSDIAAMGGRPLFFLVSLSLPPKTGKDFLERLYKGISRRATGFGCVLAGGNVSKAREISITTTVLGEAKKGDVVFRKGACPGDTVYVTGTPGDSALGLLTLKKTGLAGALKGPFKEAVKRHLDPEPRVEAGAALAKYRLATAMIDISDGLALDLERLCRESGAGAAVEVAKLPLSDGLERFRKGSKETLDWAGLILSGGEDYELLFTAPEANSSAIKRLSKKLGLRITPIGRVTSARGVRFRKGDGTPLKLKKTGFLHF